MAIQVGERVVLPDNPGERRRYLTFTVCGHPVKALRVWIRDQLFLESIGPAIPGSIEIPLDLNTDDVWVEVE